MFRPVESSLKKLILPITAALAALPILLASAAAPAKDLARAATFVVSTQQADGGFGGSGAGQTMDAIYALRAAGIDPATVMKGGKSPADFLKANAAAAVKPAAAAKAALGARALGLDPRNVNGTNLIANITAGYDAARGEYAGDAFSQSIAMLGLSCTGNALPSGAIVALRKAQIADGGWGFGSDSDADTTGIALQALVASGAGASDGAVVKAVAYLKKTQGTDGGWGFDPAESNTSSTAFVVQALIAAGEDVDGATYRKGTVGPMAYLLSQQVADGSFKGFDAAFATNQVLPAIAGRTFCNAADTPIAPIAAQPAPRPAAPLPPNTGNGRAIAGDSPLTVAGAFVLLAGAISLGAARKRR